MWISKKKLRKILNEEFDHGMAVGESIGHYQIADEARKAYDEGKIEWWLEKQRPKTLEEWDKWREENGPLD